MFRIYLNKMQKTRRWRLLFWMPFLHGNFMFCQVNKSTGMWTDICPLPFATTNLSLTLNSTRNKKRKNSFIQTNEVWPKFRSMKNRRRRADADTANIQFDLSVHLKCMTCGCTSPLVALNRKRASKEECTTRRHSSQIPSTTTTAKTNCEAEKHRQHIALAHRQRQKKN